MKKVLIVGFGSIGNRHLNNFASFGCAMAVVSRRPLELKEPVYSGIGEALPKFQPDIVFICNETIEHSRSLDILAELNFKGLVIVEKPLFHTAEINLSKYESLNVKVAYHMRFNPLIAKLKNDLKTAQGVSSAVAYVGQYLPIWRRSSTDYRKNYSAFKEKGGGVLLDLSHELDYCMTLFGDFVSGLGRVEKNSNLEITSDDSVALNTITERCSQLTIHLNYTDRITQRFLICNTDEFTVKIDFIKKTYQKNEEQADMSHDGLDPYLMMADNILNRNGDSMTTFSEGVRLNKVIDQFRASSDQKKWVQL